MSYQSRSPRQLAIARGQTRYMGRPCKRVGHVGLRWTKSGGCVDCSTTLDRTPERKAYIKSWKATHPGAVKKHTADWKARQVAAPRQVAAQGL